MQNRLRSGEFRGVPTEWMEALNTATRTAELQERYGDRLTVDYIMSDERSERELNVLRSAVVNAMGEDSPLVNEIDLALGTPVAADVPNIADVRANNWRSLRDAALDAGDPEQAQRITTLGQEWEAADAAGDNTRMEQLAEVSSVLARANTEIRDTNAQAEAYLGAVDSAYRLNAILQENRNINYFFGGALPSAIMSAVGEISAVSSLLNGNDVSVTDAMTSVENFEKDIERRFLAGDISEDARAYAIYKAQEARLAFQLARLQQGTGGVISNADFDTALTQVRPSRNPDTFEASIRGLVGAEEVKVRSSVDSLLRNPQIQIAQELQNGLGVDFTAGALRTIEERAADVGAEQALVWMQGGPAIAPQTGNTPDPAAAIGEMSDDVFRSTIAGLYDPETNTFDYSGYSEAEKEAIRQRLLNLKGSN
jgi:hypothetical protein